MMLRVASARLLRPAVNRGLRPAAALYSTRQWQQTRGFALITVPVPKMGESISEGSIASWQKEVGDSVEVDEVVSEINTDKVTVEVRSPKAGVITKHFAEVDQTVQVGADLFTLDTEAKGNSSKAQPSKDDTPKDTQPKQQEQPQQQPSKPEPKHEDPKSAKPAEDKARSAAPQPPSSKSTTQTAGKGFVPSVSYATPAPRTETRVAMTRMRLRIAERLKLSQNTNAILTTFNEIDMHELITMRNTLKDDFEKKHGVKLGFMSAFVKAAANALIAEPTINAVIDGGEIVYRNYVDVSVAVSSPTGLVVPVLRDVHNMSFADIEKAVATYGEKAAKNTLALEDMVGGTFTVSNGGIFGSLMSTPIINPPQSAVLGMHGINKRAWVVNDQIVIRPIMLVAMSYDHRLVDGREAVVFLRHIKRQIENPRSMLLDL